MTPTLKTLTLVDIAKIGVFEDEYMERFRGKRTGKEYEAHQAAYRIIRGEPGFGDEEIVRKMYELDVRDRFHKNGKLPRFFRINIYEKP